ncbi:MAG: hypothetical protein [Microviridae sp.]|nr:MAG: hypothetical protein [Microviridae sp.]
MKSYKKQKANITLLKVNTSYTGETIEKKIRRIENNKEPITDGAPLIYTERKNGVQPEYDIKTDRFEIAIEAMDKVSKAQVAKRESIASIGEQAKEGMKKENGGAEPIVATDIK